MKSILAVVAMSLILASCQSGKDDADTAQDQSAATETAPATETAASPGSGTMGQLVDIGGDRHLYMQSYGAGEYAVVIETAIGDNASAWRPIIDAITNDTRVITYMRAGYGSSDPGPMPRSADGIARDLDAMLASAAVQPPYILVGHSSGAVDALIYAAEHRHRLAGLVLLDPIPAELMKGDRFPDLAKMSDDKTAGFRREADAARGRGDGTQAAFYDAMASEHEELFRSGWALMGTVGPLGNLPLVVVGSDVPNPQHGASAAAVHDLWQRSNQTIARLSTRGRFVAVPGSSHELPRDAPEAIIDAIRNCLDMAAETQEPDYWQEDK